MRVSAGSLSLLCLLALLPLAGRAGDRLVVFVAYDPAAPLDASRSYACEALAPDDASYDAHRAGRLPLDCRRIPLADLCGTVGAGDAKTLDPDCHLLPVAGRSPTDAQVRQFADGLEAYFKGNLPKLNFTLLEMSRRPGAGFRANLRAGPKGASPAVGAWDAAAPAERVALATPLLTVDPAQPDTRYGNGWQNPYGSEWGGYLSKRTLDEVESDVRRALATPENPVPSATAVATRASAEVARCRGSSVDALRADLRSHVARMAGRSAPRPALDLPGNCKVDAAPALVLPPPPPPREWTATKPCGSGARTFTSTVSQADANRMAREFRCPTWTASACGDTFTSSVSQADANRQAAERRPCTYTAYKTCGSQTRSFTSSVSQAAAAAAARAWSCPGTTRVTSRVSNPPTPDPDPDPETYTASKRCGSGEQEFESTVSQADANRKAREFRCPTWAASACGTTFTSDVSQADANRQAAERRPCTYTAYKDCPSGPRSFTSSVSQAAADAQAAAASCPTWTFTKSCPWGDPKTFTSDVSPGDARAQANRWSCPEPPEYEASACGRTFKSRVSQDAADRKAAAALPCGTFTKSCPNGQSRRFTSNVSQADAQAQADAWSCPPPPVYTATDCKGVAHRAATRAAANALAAAVQCPVSRPAVQRQLYETSYDVRDGECDSSDPTCGGTRDESTFDPTDKVHVVVQQPAPAPAPRTYYAYRTCSGSRKSFRSTVSQSAAQRLASAYRCPATTRTYYAYRTCSGSRKTFRSTVSQSAANRLANAYRCPAAARTYYAYRTCGIGVRRTFSSRVSQAAANSRASAFVCEAGPPRTRTYYAYRTCSGSRKTFSSRVSQAAANRLANAYRCPATTSAATPRRVMMCNGRYVYASSCAGR